jgi:hypothetical protein
MLRYPEEVEAEIDALRPAQVGAPDLTTVLRHLEQVLGRGLAVQEASELYAALDDQEELGHFAPVERSIIETAIAALLFAGAGEWVMNDSAVAERLSLALERSVPRLDDIREPRDDNRLAQPGGAGSGAGQAPSGPSEGQLWSMVRRAGALSAG